MRTVDDNPFSKKVTQAALDHAMKEFPYESCGLVIAGEYVECVNKADDPVEDFKISKVAVGEAVKSGKLEGVWHSHTLGQNEPSMADLQSHISTAVPWGIHVLKEKAGGPTFVNTLTLGDHTLDTPLEGRVWVSGVYDCFGLVRSYFWQKHKMLIPDFAREGDWWDHDLRGLFRERLEQMKSFRIMPPDTMPQKDDIVLMAIRSSIPNHFGVMVEDELVIHHMAGALSVIRPYATVQGMMTNVLRPKDV